MRERRGKQTGPAQPAAGLTVDEAATEISFLFDEVIDVLLAAVEKSSGRAPFDFVDDAHARCRLDDELARRLDLVAEHLEVLTAAAGNIAAPR